MLPLVSREGKGFLLAAVLALAVTVTYSNHFDNGFHLDDTHTIVNNVYINSLHNIPLFFKDGTTFSSLPTNQSYRPVVTTTLAIDYWQGGGVHNTFFFHLSTFLLFLLQGLFMYFLYLKIFGISGEERLGAASAFLSVSWYLLHPANAETINYVIARSDTLSTLSIVLAFVLFIYSPFCRKWHIYLIPVAAGALAKPIAGVFAPLLLAYLLLFEKKMSLSDLFRGSGIKHAFPALNTAMPAIICSIALMVFIKKMEPPTWTAGDISGFHYLITQPYVILHYFVTFFVPAGLSADTDWRRLDSITDIRFFIGTAFLIILFLASAVSSKKEKTRPITFGLLWFFIALLPTSLIPLSEVMNDHRIFLPYVGLTMSVSWSIILMLSAIKKSLPSGQYFTRITVSILAALMMAYAFGTYQRNKVWKTEETLWRDVTQKSPKNARGLMNFGIALMARNDYAGAERNFTEALQMTPDFPYLLINMGVLKMSTGRQGEAEQHFRKAIAHGPGDPYCYFYYACFLAEYKRTNEAIRNLEKALQLSPAHPGSRYLLMALYYENKDMDRLKALAQETLRIIPRDSKALFYLAAIKTRL